MRGPRSELRSLIGALLLVSLAATARAEPARRVGLRLEWQAEIFLFDDATKAAISTDTLAAVVRLLHEKGSTFPAWQAAQEGEEYDAEWILRLRQETVTVTSGDRRVPAWKVWLEHRVAVAGNETELPLTEEDKLLYDIGSVIPRRSAQKLQRRIDEILKRQIEDEFLEALKVTLIHKLALTEKILVVPGRRQVIVPIHLQEIRASTDSLIGVDLAKNGITYGKVVLKAASRVVEGDHLGTVLGRITSLEVPPFDFPLPAWWHEDVPQVFGDADSHWVYMHEYHADLSAGTGTADGDIEDPDG